MRLVFYPFSDYTPQNNTRFDTWIAFSTPKQLLRGYHLRFSMPKQLLHGYCLRFLMPQQYLLRTFIALFNPSTTLVADLDRLFNAHTTLVATLDSGFQYENDMRRTRIIIAYSPALTIIPSASPPRHRGAG